MPSVKELMQGNQRFQKESSYVQGNLSPTSVKNAVGRSDVGGSASEMSDFLGAVMNTAPKAIDAYNKGENEKNAKLKKQGYLEYKSAKPSSLKKFRENSPLSENPYYKWGTDTADAEMVLQKKANSYEQEYNTWKFNKPEDGPKTHDEFNEAWLESNRPDLGNRNPIIMGESFWPGMDAVMAAKAKDHNQYEAQIYKEKTERTRESSYGVDVNDPDAENELLKSNERMETIIANEESIENELALLDRFAYGNTKLDKEDRLKGNTTPLQRNLIAEVFGDKISTGGQTHDPSTIVKGKPDPIAPIILEQSTCENIFSDYKLQTEMGELYVKPAGDITTAEYKKASHYPEIATSDSDSGRGGRMQTKPSKTEVTAKSGKGGRMKNKPKKTKVAEAPSQDAKAPIYKVQTYGAMSYMNETKTKEFFPKIQNTFSSILEGVMSDSSLPKEVYGSFVANKWRGTGRLQIQYKMPPQNILDQHPEAKKINEDLMKKVMQELEITTPLTNEGML